MYVNSLPGMAPFPSSQDVGDVYSGYLGAVGALAALYRVRETGRGESVDIAQYEAVLRSQGQNMMAELNTGNPISHTPFPNAELVAGYGAYECSDGKPLRGDDARSGRVQERHGGARAALRDRRDSRRLGAFVSQYARREDD